ncbi:MAG: hypothetical protein AAF594_15410 [Bacteroidota bacterium]
MSVFLLIAGVLVVLYGILRPEQRLPARPGRPSAVGGSVIFGLLCVAGAALLTGPFSPDDEPAPVPRAGAVEEEPETPDAAWPGGEAARDSTVRTLLALGRDARYPEAADRARALAQASYAAPWADSLRDVAREAEERALLDQVRRLPASAVRENWLAYTDLARRFPDSPRLGEYVARRDAYERRLIEEQARQLAPAPPAQAAEAAPPTARPVDPEPAEPVVIADSVAMPCCRVCVRGKPCGNTCIARNRECRSPPGCACQG